MKKIFTLFCLVLIGITTWAAQSPNGTPNYKALLIGIENYSSPTWNKNGSFVKDAEALEQVLISEYGFSTVETLYNQNATRENIISELDKLVTKASEDDYILVFFGGHGIEVGKDGYWVPSDAKNEDVAGLISNSLIREVIAKSSSKHILMLVDACFSELSGEALATITNDGTEGYYTQVDELISRQAIISGSNSPTIDEKTEKSIFMKYVLNFLSLNEKPAMDAVELYDFLKYPIFANTPNIPRLEPIKETGDKGGQFLFRKGGENVAVNDKAVVEEKCTLTANIKQGRSVTFTNLSSKLEATANQEAQFQWFYNDEPMGITVATVVADKEGIYRVIVSTSPNCQESLSSFVKIDLTPADVYIKEGSRIEYTLKGEINAVATGDGVTYEWKRNGVIIGDEPRIMTYEGGLYTISVFQSGKKMAEATANVTVNPRVYKVKEGDKVETIAKKFYGDEAKDYLIYDANIEKIKGELTTGLVLVIPLEEAILAKRQSKFRTTVGLAGVKGFAPFSMPGIYNDGIVTELVKESFKLIGQGIEIDFLGLNEVKGATFNGKYAAAFPCQKSERDARTMKFSEPIYEVYNVFFAKKDANVNFSSPRKLRGKKVAVVIGYNINELSEFYKKKYITIRPVRSLEEAFKMLQEGTVDLVATSQIAGFGMIKNNDSFKVDEFKVLLEQIGSSTLHLAVSIKNPTGNEIIRAFNEALKQLKDSGKADLIIDQHLDKFQNRP
jgi:hypothetical protein